MGQAEEQQVAEPAQDSGAPALTADAREHSLQRHYYEDRNYRRRIPQMLREYHEIIENSERVLAHRNELTYEPEISAFVAQEAIKFGNQLIDNVQDSSIPAGFALEVATHPERFTDEEINATDPRILANIAFVQTALEIPMGNALITRASRDKVVLVSQEEMPIVDGFFDPKVDVLTSTTGDLSDYRIDANKFLVFYEELFHADQVNRNHIDRQMEPGRLHRQDAGLWSLGAEANAKVAAALMIMEHAENGHDDLRREILANIDSEPDKAVFKAVNEAYEKYGLEAIRNNPSLLAPAFEAFFGENGMASEYMQLYLMNMDMTRVSDPDEFRRIMRGTRHISMDDFVDTFGRIPGLHGNMLEGRYQSREDLVRLMPEESQFRKWLTGEFTFAAETAPVGGGREPVAAPHHGPH